MSFLKIFHISSWFVSLLIQVCIKVLGYELTHYLFFIDFLFYTHVNVNDFLCYIHVNVNDFLCYTHINANDFLFYTHVNDFLFHTRVNI